MTLPVGSLSMSQIAAELGLSLPLSLQHAWVRALAQVSGAACDFNSLRGKTGRFDGNLPTQASAGFFITFNNAPFFGGGLQTAQYIVNTGEADIFFNALPAAWRGNLLLRNNSTGAQAVLAFNPTSPGFWQTMSAPANLMRNGAVDSYTILPN
jgi:hypothetical protein